MVNLSLSTSLPKVRNLKQSIINPVPSTQSNRIMNKTSFVKLCSMWNVNLMIKKSKIYSSNRMFIYWNNQFQKYKLFDTAMSSNKYDSKDNNQKTNLDQQGFKVVCFQTLHCLIRSNETIHNVFYYVLMVIQFLQIFYYITHPYFPYYKTSVIMNNIHKLISYLVFNEFLSQDSNIYKFILPICLAFVLLQIILLSVIVKEVKQRKLINQIRKVHYLANLMFLVFNSILTIPFFGTALNVIYCDTENNRYTLGQQCYAGAHIGYCILAGFIIASILIQGGINWYIYYNKNPFGTDFLAKYENNAVLGKFLIKIIPLVYITVDSNLDLLNVYAFGITACLCGYIFFFRLFAFHDYNEFNFYLVVFLQVVLAWFAINSSILSYLGNQRKMGGLFECFLCSILAGVLIIQIEDESYRKIFMEGMETQKIKKQNVEKFLYRLIYMFMHSQTEDQKNHLSTVVKMLDSKFKEGSETSEVSSKVNKKIENNFYSFLSKFLAEHLQSNSNVMLFAANCNLLIFQEKFSFAFHQSLQLSNKKISVVEQLMMYRFRRNSRYDREKLDTTKKQNTNTFMMYYDFNKNLMRMQQEIALCAFNNLDYWEEVCEPDPSIYKIRNLAQKYEQHQDFIDQNYTKIYEIFPNNKLALRSYIEFLMQIGVSIQNLTKARQRYEQAEQNIKKTKQLERDSGNLIEMGQNENLAYISIQTNEISLGNIKNCNSEFKKMLGYQKNELVDKKVNKIMPKSFSEFHDSVVRGYIQKKQHNQKNKVERIVYALSKQNFLVQVVLFTKVNYKTVGQRPDLELIGFLKKIENPNKAIIILQMNSQNIVGANAGFSRLIQDGVSNSEFANSQIRICTLLPSLNSDLIQQGKAQQTNLIFSSSVIVSKSGLNLQVKKKVLIQVENIREYSSKQKFAYLVLKELISQEHQVNTWGIRRQVNQKVQTKKSAQFIDKEAPKEVCLKVKLLSSRVSIMDDHTTSTRTFDQQTLKLPHSQSDKDNDAFSLIERKKEQFLKNQHLEIFRYVLWFTLISLVCLTIGAFVYSTVLNYELLNTSKQIKNQIKNSYTITYQTAQINKNIEKIMQGNAYNQTEFKQISKKLSVSISDLQENFIPLMTMSVKYDFPLELNQFRYYDIVIDKQSGNAEYAEETFIDAFFQYISSSKNYASYSLSDVTTDAVHEMIQEHVFIQENGKQLFPSISKNMSFEYLDLDAHLFKQHQTKQLLMSIIYSTNMILTLMFIAILIRKINTFNQSVVSLYNEIKLWDATQMKHKCVRFIQKNSTKTGKIYSKRRMSSFLNVFPQQTFLKVIQSMIGTQNQNPNKNLNNSSDDQQLLKKQTDQHEQGKEIAVSRVSNRQSKFYVSMVQKNKLKSKFSIFGVIACFFIVLCFLKYVYLEQFESKVLYYNKRISELGRVRDNLSFMNYYTYKIMTKPTDQDFRRLLQREVDEFYKNTDACYDLIGDPSTILKDSYNLVQEITALVFSKTLNIPDSQRYSIRNKKYLLQEQLFLESIKKLSVIINEDISQKAEQLFILIRAINLSFCLGFIFLTVIFVTTIKCWMLQQILRNSKKSKSMVMMLSPWLIERNKGIQAFLK